jgi:predicted lipid-binding transport protein (Tim44 family)
MFQQRLLTLALFLLPAVELHARAGGGRNGGGGILYIILMPFLIIYAWYVNRKIDAKDETARKMMAAIERRHGTWASTKLAAFVRKDFFAIQNAWCDQDLKFLERRLGDTLYGQWKRDLKNLADKGQRNVMEGLTLDKIRFVEVRNYKDDRKDSFTVCLDATATDYTVDRSGRLTDSNATTLWGRAATEKKQRSFREFWTYTRLDRDDWRLDLIEQEKAWRHLVDEDLVNEDKV